MENKRKSYLNKKSLIFLGVIFVGFCLLAYMFPYSGDDFGWGSQWGIEKLQQFFNGYNGRYAGNLLVMLLTRVNVLRAIIVAATIPAIIYIAQRYSGKAEFLPMLFVLLMILVTPKDIFAQSFVWTSGFSNYLPPILLITSYILITRNIFDKQEPKYSKCCSCLTFFIGLIGSLFMENLTLYSLVLAVAVIIWTFIMFKKIYATHVSYFIGNIIGAVIMFSNSAYWNIMKGEDEYRTTALNSGLKTIFYHTRRVVEYLFTDNIIAVALISLICLALVILYLKNKDCTKKNKIMVILSTAVNLFAVVCFAAKKMAFNLKIVHDNTILELLVWAVLFMSVLLYCISILTIIICCVEDKSSKYKLIFLMLNVPVMVAPLLVVKPIGPRCFFPPYLILIMFTTVLFNVFIEKLNLKSKKTLTLVISVLSVAIFASIFVIYSTIHVYDVKRNEYAIKQSNLGYETIEICKLPYESYVWASDPNGDGDIAKYKMFYNINEKSQFHFIEYKDFEKWVEIFENKK